MEWIMFPFAMNLVFLIIAISVTVFITFVLLWFSLSLAQKQDSERFDWEKTQE